MKPIIPDYIHYRNSVGKKHGFKISETVIDEEQELIRTEWRCTESVLRKSGVLRHWEKAPTRKKRVGRGILIDFYYVYRDGDDHFKIILEEQVPEAVSYTGKLQVADYGSDEFNESVKEWFGTMADMRDSGLIDHMPNLKKRASVTHWEENRSSELKKIDNDMALYSEERSSKEYREIQRIAYIEEERTRWAALKKERLSGEVATEKEPDEYRNNIIDSTLYFVNMLANRVNGTSNDVGGLYFTNAYEIESKMNELVELLANATVLKKRTFSVINGGRSDD